MIDSIVLFLDFEFVKSIVAGVIGSFIFLFIALFMLKPKVKICDKIAFEPNGSDTFYLFKFVNKSLFMAYDVTVELIQREKVPYGSGSDGGTRYNIVTSKIGEPRRFVKIEGNRWGIFRRDEDALHAIRIKTTNDIRKILEVPSQVIELRVTLRHGLSGLSGSYSRTYPTTTYLQKGNYGHGSSFEIN